MSFSFPPQPIKTGNFFAEHRAKSFVYAGIFLLLVAGVITWEALRVTAPPYLEVTFPPDNYLTKETTVLVSGSAAKNSSITINSEPTTPNLAGNFKETLDLRTGLNVITIMAAKRFAKPNIIYRRVVVTK